MRRLMSGARLSTKSADYVSQQFTTSDASCLQSDHLPCYEGRLAGSAACDCLVNGRIPERVAQFGRERRNLRHRVLAHRHVHRRHPQ